MRPFANVRRLFGTAMLVAVLMPATGAAPLCPRSFKTEQDICGCCVRAGTARGSDRPITTVGRTMTCCDLRPVPAAPQTATPAASSAPSPANAGSTADDVCAIRVAMSVPSLAGAFPRSESPPGFAPHSLTILRI